jgi:site-specific DNA-methyltransferase (adenine-specific)
MNIMSEIKLIKGDCLIEMKNIPDESIDLICTDPPYRVTPKGCAGTMSGYWTNERTNKGKIFENNDIDIQDYIHELYRVLKEKTHCYIMCNQVNLPLFLQVISESKFKFIKCLIWDKGNKICGRFYMNCFEYIIMLRKGGERPINNCGTPDILSVPNKKTKSSNGKNIHDSEKPIALMQILIQNSSNEGDIVLDLFMGSGTTGLAAIKSNRDFIGIELDEEYFAIAEKRIKEARQQLTLF